MVATHVREGLLSPGRSEKANQAIENSGANGGSRLAFRG